MKLKFRNNINNINVNTIIQICKMIVENNQIKNKAKDITHN